MFPVQLPDELWPQRNRDKPEQSQPTDATQGETFPCDDLSSYDEVIPQPETETPKQGGGGVWASRLRKKDEDAL